MKATRYLLVLTLGCSSGSNHGARTPFSSDNQINTTGSENSIPSEAPGNSTNCALADASSPVSVTGRNLRLLGDGDDKRPSTKPPECGTYLDQITGIRAQSKSKSTATFVIVIADKNRLEKILNPQSNLGTSVEWSFRYKTKDQTGNADASQVCSVAAGRASAECSVNPMQLTASDEPTIIIAQLKLVKPPHSGPSEFSDEAKFGKWYRMNTTWFTDPFLPFGGQGLMPGTDLGGNFPVYGSKIIPDGKRGAIYVAGGFDGGGLVSYFVWKIQLDAGKATISHFGVRNTAFKDTQLLAGLVSGDSLFLVVSSVAATAGDVKVIRLDLNSGEYEQLGTLLAQHCSNLRSNVLDASTPRASIWTSGWCMMSGGGVVAHQALYLDGESARFGQKQETNLQPLSFNSLGQYSILPFNSHLYAIADGDNHSEVFRCNTQSDACIWEKLAVKLPKLSSWEYLVSFPVKDGIITWSGEDPSNATINGALVGGVLIDFENPNAPLVKPIATDPKIAKPRQYGHGFQISDGPYSAIFGGTRGLEVGREVADGFTFNWQTGASFPMNGEEFGGRSLHFATTTVNDVTYLLRVPAVAYQTVNGDVYPDTPELYRFDVSK